ncbi:MAG: endolytic transglycosylase MltG, partial [Ruminococcus sp.]|nr:endolytic transglycosylase MltG [Ruminococcus sp.]
MDDRRYDGFGSEPPKGESTYDYFYSTERSKKSDFRVSINDDSYGQPVSSGGSMGATRPATDDGRFKVSIPEQNPRTNPQTARRTASGSTARNTSGKAAAAKRQPPKKGKTPAKSSKSKAQKKERFLKKSILLCACLIAIAIITTVVSTIALATINDILAINKESGTTVSVVINEGDTFDDVIDTLADNDLISQKLLVKLFCKFRHYDGYFSTKQNKYIEIQYVPGVYYLETNSGVESMLESMRESSSGSRETVRLTFPEGWTIAQIFQKIEKYGVCTAEKLYA